MQFTGKAPHIGLSAAMRDRKELDQVNGFVVDALAQDPAFQVRTVDGKSWICPFSGALVPCAADSLLDAQQYLFRNRPWMLRRGGKHRPVFQVLEQKWTLHLTADADPRFRDFDKAGAWRNPFTGARLLLPRVRSAADPRAIAEIARALAGSPEAQAGGAPV